MRRVENLFICTYKQKLQDKVRYSRRPVFC